MLHAGLTGNIASGKSHAATVFAKLGAHIVDADVIARQLLSPGTETYRKVVDSFGPSIVCEDRNVDRRRLGDIIFNDAAARGVLNGIVHPAVRDEIVRQIARIERGGGGGVVIVDAALMVETGSYKLYDRLVVVRCEPAIQLARLMQRDGLSEADARSRIAAQMPAGEKARVADYVIDSSGSFAETARQVEAVYRLLMAEDARSRLHPEA